MPVRSRLIARSILCSALGVIAAILPAGAAHAAPGQIRIVKTDQLADPVVGAVFQAFSSDGDGMFEPDEASGDTLAAECVTDAAGECVLGPLAAGDYFVREAEAPPDYEPDAVRGPITTTDDTDLVIDRATDLDGDGLPPG